MTWPSFPAAEVTSAEPSLVQMCSGFAQTTVVSGDLEHSAGALQPSRSGRASSTGQTGCARPRLPLDPWFAPPGQTYTHLAQPMPVGLLCLC